MNPDQSDPSNGGQDIVRAIDARVRTIDSGQYAKLTEHVLRSRWLPWLRREREVQKIEDLDTLDCRRFAQHLHALVEDGDIAGSTANRDFDVVRAFLGWCVDDERLDRNPAAPNRAADPLPEAVSENDRDFWSPEDRDRLLRHVDDRADRAFDADSDVDPVGAQRDRALAYLLAFSGVRIGEIVRDPQDDRKNGLRWDHVNLERGVMRVFGKTREWQSVPLPSDTASRLNRYRRVLEPPTDDWPVFPTRHAPTVSRRVRTHVADDEVDRRLEAGETTVHDLAREYEVPPPALTTNGARSVMQRLCEGAELDVDGYLRPHGGRRAAGHQVYTEASAEDAQALLRHQSVETTHRAYTDERTAETREVLDDVFDQGNPDE